MSHEIDEALEAIWMCAERNDVTLEAVKKECHVEISPELLQQLHDQKLVAFNNETVLLTRDGKEKARGIIRCHRLAETMIEHVFMTGRDQLETIACAFEHAIIPEVEESICTLLGHPTECPHGLPIPPGKCCLESREVIERTITNLLKLDPGERGKIAYIRPKNHERLHRLTAFGMNPGTVLEVHQKFPAFIIRFENTELALDEDIVEDIHVWKLSSEE